MWYYVDAFLPSNSWLIALLLIHWVEMLLLCVNIACTKKSGLFGSSDQNFILYRASSSTLSLNTSAYNVVFIVQAEAKYNCCLCRQADSGHTNWKIHVLTLFPLRQTLLPLCLWHKTYTWEQQRPPVSCIGLSQPGNQYLHGQCWRLGLKLQPKVSSGMSIWPYSCWWYTVPLRYPPPPPHPPTDK